MKELRPYFTEILFDTDTPVSLHYRLNRGEKYSCLLESVESGEKIGRYSIVSSSVDFAVEFDGRDFIHKDPAGRITSRQKTKDPVSGLKKLISGYSFKETPGAPQFSGGFAGYFAYEFIHFIEKKIPERMISVPYFTLLFIREFVVVDHFRHSAFVVCLEEDSLKGKKRADIRLQETIQRMSSGMNIPGISGGGSELKIKDNMTKREYTGMVVRAKKDIYDGEIIQVVPSRKFIVENPPDSFSIYRALRRVNPSPYMYYFSMDDLNIAGSSPETLVSLTGGTARIRPIAGTRPRGATEALDKKLGEELLKDKKELAEHVMLLDLGRNDLGRVCYPGSVRVERNMTIERFSHVMHIVSEVAGRLKKGMDMIDLLCASFPAGTVSGAPKVRAMEIISRLEKEERGIYAGCAGYIGLSGNMDMAITIRTLTIKDKKAVIQAGAGIVFDSVPETEYEETAAKAKAMISAVRMAAGKESKCSKGL